MQLKRVVVTGLGALTPIGNNKEEYWNSLVNGVSGAAPITYFDAAKFKTRFACELKNFNATDFINRKEARKMDKFTQYAMVASDEAIADAKLNLDDVNKLRVGVIWGAGIGGLETFQNEVLNYAEGDGSPRFNPFFIPKMIADIAPGNISIKNGFMGPNYTTVSACASSANAMIDALNYIRLGHCDVVVTGGSEAAVTIAGMGGFNAMHALSTRNESPETASRPFDAERDGFVLGEGAGAIVLEEYEHAKARGAKIYAEVIGGGLSSDAYHMTAPHPDGIGVIAVMKNCLENAGIKPEDVDHINTHGTSTPLGDVAELKAISEVFGDHAKNININSTKSMTGHLLGAAGAIEAIASLLAMEHGVVPPTINHVNVDENINPELNLTLNNAQKRDIKVAMSNTFGFGGHNACIAFRKLD
ncbi:3-oxoacyl-[acyl-carrier-protein] synthase II [Tenacibaculum mesophilum]|uniref:3-oxoacyl-[acyl-carrier-protein] synthase 2 n=1 Tax=Tenacibaculum mesophilum TaxID=104268 RepID=A0AAE9MNF7_9FLAO|nr:beta-ketoacyl-ACP synthase II [Tenacibaculum mesophilum]GFD72472.1 3-oxoacyl-[acyl-carrier-protein] synthase 2 [Tenacibaculum sp. KUL113]AZJ32835.1 beta-ketoacyl-[acyl-carrier-protein] synthase II [Tenacibaculum mesophilum]QFS28082.1 beta-ketoacyl-ACP synthase II [Tenacibaculum mesophilum]UTD15531.1 beta-ketoacyl-ACP synthase II [Tenacibaculum mesophilum]SHF73146.1 3-oxoacyl-[acyl-carrier-protein] synthase II [Tenacibaculum mesophilum]|eukprot:TRINITY_DN652_c0_g1_i1.p1 TRINITY_DN652_c0_g1~~TRINITY_DN652_c0_g1_i1.p1  ORF type:complete len:417 (+),score=85.80 TRINITY_DN652_c0_g1_i1:2168-3418(+)